MSSDRKFKIYLFIFLFFIYSYSWHKPNWNDLSRYDLIMAIVDERTLKIDTYHTNTGDKAFINGHYYSDKAPGLAFLGVPIYWILSQSLEISGWKLIKDPTFASRIWFYKLVLIRILIIGLSSAILGIFLYDFLSKNILSKEFSLWITLGYSLGSLAFPYSTLFYGHQFSAVFLFISFFMIYQKPVNDSLTFWKLIIAGLLNGYAVISEYPVILVSLALIIYLMVKYQNIRFILIYLGGILIPVLILLFYNYQCFGNIFGLGYLHEAGDIFRKEMGEGFAGVTYPKLSALWGITFGLDRGLFWVNPVYLASLPGFYFMSKNPSWRKEFWLCILSVGIYLLFNSSYYMWWGGWSLGPRHLIPVLPFLIFSIAFIPSKNWKLIYPIIIISILYMWAGTVTDPQVPDSVTNPLFQHTFPNLMEGKVSMNLGSKLNITSRIGAYLLLPFIGMGMYGLFQELKRNQNQVK